MKFNKIALALLTTIMFTTIAAPGIVLADQEIPTECRMKADVSAYMDGCPSSGSTCAFDNPSYDCSLCCLMSTVIYVTNWIFIAVMVVSVLMILMGAYNYVTAAGSPEKTMAGRNYIMYAAIGIAVALLAKAVPALVRTIVGV